MMSREIKFRAWDESRKTMIYRFSNDKSQTPSILQRDNEGEFDLFCGSYDLQGDWDELPLMQYTGLKDKNRNEIYEGDVCKYHDGSIGFIRFDYGWAIQYSKEYSHNMPPYYAEHLEVIGNIYETHELIKNEM